MSKLVIGLIGEQGAGKETFANILENLLPKKRIIRVRTGDLLRETLSLWSLPNTRSNLQNLSIIMRRQYGADVLPNAIRTHIIKSKADIVILDGMRWGADYQLLRSFPRNILIYITALPKLRFSRLRLRSEKVGETSMSFKKFSTEEVADTEVMIPKLGASTEIKITNDGTLDNLKEIIKFYLPRFI